MIKIIENDISILLSAGEGQTLELKKSVASSSARSMVAFANSGGGRIIFGVDDKGRVLGISNVNRDTAAIQSIARNCDSPIEVKVQHIKYKGTSLLVADVASGDKKPHGCHDGYFLRTGSVSQKMSRDELVRLVQKNVPISFDSFPCPEFTLNDFDEQAYRSFINESEIDASQMGALDVLCNLQLLSFSDDSGPIFRNAGVLFFGKDPSKFIRQSVVTCVLFAGTDKADILDRKDFSGNLKENVVQAMAFLKRHLSLRYEIKSLVRKEILELPEQALREAFLNAVTHRDYSIVGSVVMVEIYRDRVEIVSPGGLPYGLEPSDLGKKSVHRNPLIADMFHRLGEVEKVGSGISRILKEAKEAGIPLPRFESTGFFTVTFMKPAKKQKKKTVRPKSVPSPSQVKLLKFCKTERPLLEMMETVGQKNRTRFRREVITPLLEEGFLSMTIPDNPNSSKQKYVLTKKGQVLLKKEK